MSSEVYTDNNDKTSSYENVNQTIEVKMERDFMDIFSSHSLIKKH